MIRASHTVSGLWSRLFGGGIRAAFILFLGCFGHVREAAAQLCTDPNAPLIVNEDFAQPGPLLPGQTDYNYVSFNCPYNNQYNIVSALPESCFTDTWHIVPSDHSPTGGGKYMMIVNGFDTVTDPDKLNFYKQSLPDLCPDATYEVSLYALNLLKANACGDESVKPRIMIYIETADGKTLQTFDSGSIPESATPVWRRYGTTFSVPTLTGGAVLRLVNPETAPGCGNDMVVDDIQVRQCGACAPYALSVPDAFTPNNDGLNDELAVFGEAALSFDMKVYDRWGSVVFSSNTLHQRWDGTYGGQPCPAGLYTWQIFVKPAVSTDVTNVRQYVKTGRVTLIR